VFDTLLCWTDAGYSVTHPETLPETMKATECGVSDRGYEPTPTATDYRAAYADDLADCVYSIHAQRRQVLWVKAFRAATGLEIAVNKIITVVLNASHSLLGDSLEAMTIYNSQ
jgi:hypothetical protein